MTECREVLIVNELVDVCDVQVSCELYNVGAVDAAVVSTRFIFSS